MTAAADFNRALEIFQRFGPERAIPVEQRWRKAFPLADDVEIEKWRARCERIEADALSVAVQVLDGRMGDGGAKEELRSLFPELDEDRLSHTLWQAKYFASK